MPLVTERAIGNDQGGTYLLVVNSENVVERRSVKTGQRIDGLIVIEEGVQMDDSVIVKGVQRARPGRRVEPHKTDMASLTTSALEKATEKAATPPPSDVESDTQNPDQLQ